MTSTISYIAGILFVLLGIAISIAWHELGHLLPAKKFGARVPKYMVGFGPTLFSRKRGETEYGVKAIPLGGYISISGMFPPSKQREPRGWFSKMIADAREQQRQIDGEFDPKRSFYLLSIPKRIIIMLGGPVMNLILGVVLVVAALSGLGAVQNSNQISSVAECVSASVASASCESSDPISPAKAAGLKAGDKVVSFDSKPVSLWSDLAAELQASAGKTVSIRVLRDGKNLNLEITPISVQRPVIDPQTGKAELDSTGHIITAPKTVIGVVLESVRAPIPLAESLGQSGYILGQTFQLVLNLPNQLISIAQSTFGFEERSVNSPVSLIGMGSVAGEIASSGQLDLTSKLVSGLMLLGSLNFALFVFNLIPLLPLDGGHVLSAIYEAVKRGLFKLFKKPDPGPVDTAMAVPFTMAMWVVLMLMSLLIISADIVNPIRLF